MAVELKMLDEVVLNCLVKKHSVEEIVCCFPNLKESQVYYRLKKLENYGLVWHPKKGRWHKLKGAD